MYYNVCIAFSIICNIVVEVKLSQQFSFCCSAKEEVVVNEESTQVYSPNHTALTTRIQHYKYKFIEYYRNGAILFKFEMKTTRNKNE